MDMNRGVKISIDVKDRKQIHEGWGTTIAWWGNAIGRWSDTAKKNKLMKLIFDPAEGLGLNIARYNIGGGENPSHKHMRVYADIPGYQIAPEVWDWESDAPQRRVLEKAMELGVNIVEAFSNAPPYWMTRNGCAAGAQDGSSNLKDECYDAFIDYLVKVVGHFRDHWNIAFDTLSPMNEPVRTWWKSSNNQEGCHFDIGEHERIFGTLAGRLKEAGLDGIRISGSDENSIEETIDSFSSYAENIKGLISQLNTHTYEGKARLELKHLAARYGKKLWVSEVTLGGTQEHNHNDMTSALELAQRIVDDLNIMEPAAWVYWQAVEDEAGKCNHGLIHANFIGDEEYWLTKQYYTMANFTRFIRPGFRIIQSADENVLTAYDEGSGKVILVIVNNTSEARPFEIELRHTAFGGKRVEIYRTSAEESLEQIDEVNVTEMSFVHNTMKNSITTIVICNSIAA